MLDKLTNNESGCELLIPQDTYHQTKYIKISQNLTN